MFSRKRAILAIAHANRRYTWYVGTLADSIKNHLVKSKCTIAPMTSATGSCKWTPAKRLLHRNAPHRDGDQYVVVLFNKDLNYSSSGKSIANLNGTVIKAMSATRR